ncbi:hypothetical protein [Roseobacter sp. HKCCA0434]|uniref:hypothetical protein n=1 Tax=Roseobacter sp. HKCCA0434 TaxID=3079297 RepID=UPI0029058389|nr:hypothetical protein [Roseobacter sp. HKCCA0434]
MTTIQIGKGAFTVQNAAYRHEPVSPLLPQLQGEALARAVLHVPLRFGMGEWDCRGLDGRSDAEKGQAMQAFARRARATHWLKHQAAVRGETGMDLSPGSVEELWRRLERFTGLPREGVDRWLHATFGTPRHHPDLVPWLARLMPGHRFGLTLGLMPLVIALRPEGDDLPKGTMLVLTVLVDALYHAGIAGRCGIPDRPVPALLPLRGLAGTTADAKRWSLNVAKLTARHDPLLNRAIAILRRG